MKTSNDPRHQKRIDWMEKLFSHSFKTNEDPDMAPLIEKLPDIDAMILKAASEWPLEQIAKTDLAILRLAIYELLEEKDMPTKVVIDEAVEIAKEYGNTNSAKFINGALGAVVKLINNETIQQ